MAPVVKFCGLTRPEDATAAVAAGAGFVGVIFAGGPRLLTPQRAVEVLAPVPAAVHTVGVFGAQSTREIAQVVERVGLDVVQLHADPTVEDVRTVRRESGRPVWAAVRVRGDVLPPAVAVLLREADAVVLDARVDGQLGGTGARLPWRALAGQLAAARAGGGRLVLAGGLTPETVAEAIRYLRPDVVDVSSGVERAPGIKDAARMHAFAAAVRGTPDAPLASR